MTVRITIRVTPVGLAMPGTRPNLPGRIVNSHSAYVKLPSVTACRAPSGGTTSMAAEKQKGMLEDHRTGLGSCPDLAADVVGGLILCLLISFVQIVIGEMMRRHNFRLPQAP